MKVTSSNLDSVAKLLQSATSQYADDSKAILEAQARQTVSQGNLRALQGAYDILASSHASGADLEDARAVELPASVQQAIGWTKAKSPTLQSDHPTE